MRDLHGLLDLWIQDVYDDLLHVLTCFLSSKPFERVAGTKPFKIQLEI